MIRELETDLKRLEGMAFGRLKHCGPLLKRFHAMRGRIAREPEPERIWNVYDRLLAPFTLWPLDFEGMGTHLLAQVEEGRPSVAEPMEGRRENGEGSGQGAEGRGQKSEVRGRTAERGSWICDPDLKLLLEILPGPPEESTQRVIAEFERVMEAGRYDPVLRQGAKFSEGERVLMGDGELREFWARIKARFDVARYQNKRGVVRRRVSGERNFREGWDFKWADDQSRFQVLLDALCYQWNLYGMEKDKPLLLKVTVNPTPYGTLIFIPRNISFDPRRDVDWKLVGRLHGCRVSGRQGPKLSSARVEKLKEVKKARRLWEEAGRKGNKGDARYEYVRERMKRDKGADRGWLWRLLRREKGEGRTEKGGAPTKK